MRIRILMAMLCALLGACGRTETVRYKMTVEVETPDGLKSGSAVREVKRIRGGIVLPDGPKMQVRQHGEAVVVDLPGNQTLFALLSTNGDEPLAAFGNDGLKAAQKTRRVAELQPIAGRIESQNGYPLLVTFRDITDPKTVVRVDPDDLAASFGAGVRLKRITVQVTDAPVTTGIEKRLVWFKERAKSGGNLIPMTRITIDGRTRYQPIPGHDESLVDIGLSYFSTEAYK
jgi:hypothetical protein